MKPASKRARALGLARRLAAGALQRLAREVDRLSVVLEPVRAGIALRAPGREVELEVSRRGATWPTSPQATRHVNEGPWAPASPPIRIEVTAAEASHAAQPSSPVPEASSHAPEPLATAPIEEPSARPDPVPVPLGMEQVTHLRSRIEPALAVLRESAAWERAEDTAEAIHEVRVASRRLRAFARLFAPMLGDKRARKLDRRLRTITRGLGPLREWDVLLAGLRAQHATAEPLPRAALEHVMGWAQTQRRKVVRRADEALAEMKAVGLAEAIDAELDRVCGRLLRLDEELPAAANALLEPELARAFKGMPRPRDDTDMEALHDVRIRAKRVRYALDLLQPTLPELHRSLRPPLKRVQSTIGEHREASQLAEQLKERRATLGAQGLHTLASALDTVETAASHHRQRAFGNAMRALAGLDAYTSQEAS